MQTRLLLAATVIIAVAASGVAVVRLGDDTTPGPEATPTTSPPGTPAVDGNGDGDGGGFGEFLDELTGSLLGSGLGPVELARCLGQPAPDAGAPLPDDPAAAIAAIADQVEALRELDSDEPIAPVLLAPADLAERIVALTMEDLTPEAAAEEERVLVALRAIGPDLDLRAEILTLLGEQVAGFYDPDTGELVSVSDGDLDPGVATILAHEIDHALTDRTIGLPDLAGFDGDTDAYLAAQAVVEGDATLLMQQWATRHLSLRQQLAMAGQAEAEAAAFAAAPTILQDQLTFPYLEGLTFVCRAYTAGGGWPAVDALYADLPTTSAQILWPDRYTAGEGSVDVPDPRVLDGWDELRRDTTGAADLLWLTSAPGNDRDRALTAPRARAAAWAGGELAVGQRATQTTVAITWAERPGTDHPLCETVTAWYAAANPSATTTEVAAGDAFADTDQAAVVRCDGATVRLGIGPDLETATALVA